MNYENQEISDIRQAQEDMKSYLSKVYPDHVVSALFEVLSRTYCDYQKYEYADNLRIARAGNTKAVLEYEEKRDRGCCGFFDTIVFTEQGESYLVGFNYGH